MPRREVPLSLGVTLTRERKSWFRVPRILLKRGSMTKLTGSLMGRWPR